MTIDAPIDRVTVYRLGATVCRRVEVDVEEDGEIHLAGLPLSLDDGSISARVLGEGAPTAVEVRVGLEVPEDHQEGVVEQELRDARLELGKLRAHHDHLDGVRSALQTMAPPDRPKGKPGQPPPVSPTESRLALLRFRRERLEALDEEMQVSAEAVERAEERLRDLETRRRLQSSAELSRASELRKTVHVRLRGAAGRWTVELDYSVPGARWTPSYALWFDADYRSARLVMRASVLQKTGEDWSLARLALSTAQSTRWTELPDLPSRRIGRWQPSPPPAGWRPLPAGVDALYADYDRAVRAAPEPEEEVYRSASAAVIGGSAAAMMGGGGGADLDDLEEEYEESVEMVMEASLAPAPPPPSGAPMRAAAPASLSRSSALPSKSKKRRSKSRRRDVSRPSRPGALAAPTDRLDYGSLRLVGPEQSSRGVLQPLTLEARYQVHTVSTLTVTASVVGALHAAQADARSVGSVARPPGCLPVESIDDYDHIWRADHPVDVPSDGTWHSVTLTELEGPTTLSYVTVPRESSDVFRMVRFAHPGDAPMAGGPVDVYVDGGFLLTSSIRSVASGGEVSLGLGVEQGLKVARNTRFEEKSRGLLGGSRSLEHEIHVDVRSTLGWPARLEVRERIPVADARNSDITITEAAVNPPWKPLEQRPPVEGGRVWTITVEAGKRVELRAAYAVQISSAHELVGGDRRDR